MLTNEIHQKVKIVIMMGLPGSGKTYYADNYKSKFPAFDHVSVIHFDEYMEKYNTVKEVIDYNLEHIVRFTYKSEDLPNVIIYDGPWFTVNDIKKLISGTDECIGKVYVDKYYNQIHVQFDVDSVEIVKFDENREACLLNDKYRREKSSAITIQHAPFDNNIKTEDFADVKRQYSIMITEVTVERHTMWDIVFAPLCRTIERKGSRYLISESWTTGGEWGNCWGDSGSVDAEPPKEFKAFDNLLVKLCPDIPFLKYKMLYNECCEAGEDSDYGYYGSYTHYAYWYCDLRKLHDMMLDMGLITEYPE